MSDLRRLERWLVHLIAAHSYGVGLVLLCAPAWAAAFGGWGAASPLFFPRQAGVFHLILASAYLVELHRHRGVSLLLAAKATAVVFLLGATALGETAWAVPFSGIADAAMGLAVWQVHRRVR